MIPHGAGVNHAVSQTCHCLNESMFAGNAGVNQIVSQTCHCLNESMGVSSAGVNHNSVTNLPLSE